MIQEEREKMRSTTLLSTPPLSTEKAFPTELRDLLAPLSTETFFQKYVDQKPLHLAGAFEKFSDLMSFDRLNHLLSMAFFWTPQTLQLAFEGQMVEPRFYCAPMNSQNGVALRPIPEKVMGHLAQGASLVCNEIDGLTPELRALRDLLGQAFQGKIQANLYVSWQQKQAFKSHFDTHDVWAFQTVGEKIWHLYQGRADHPIAHPAFKNFGQAHHEHKRGELLGELCLKPGDILYIPRGVYHDALASTQASMHVTFGITRPIGLDVLSLLFEHAIEVPFFRQNIPQTDHFRYLKRLEKECTHLLGSEKFRAAFSHLQGHFFSTFSDYHLPVKKEED